jgi:hypothetical protein
VGRSLAWVRLTRRGDDQPAGHVVRLGPVESDDGLDEEGPFSAWLPPDDRLWRHPSEVPVPGGRAARSPRERPGSGGRTTTPAMLSLWTSAPLTRLWTIAVVAGIIGAVTASGLGMVSGAFERRTTVVHSVVPTAPADTLA